MAFDLIPCAHGPADGSVGILPPLVVPGAQMLTIRRLGAFILLVIVIVAVSYLVGAWIGPVSAAHGMSHPATPLRMARDRDAANHGTAVPGRAWASAARVTDGA